MASTQQTLWQLEKGQRCEIRGLDPGLRPGYRTRLLELGFVPGAPVTCLVAPRLGAPKLYRVRNSVYSLERALARAVHVTVNP